MKFTPPDTCLEDYEKRRGAFLKDLIAFTPNVSVRAREFRRWIDENSPYSDTQTRNRRVPGYRDTTKRPGGGRDALGPIIRRSTRGAEAPFDSEQFRSAPRTYRDLCGRLSVLGPRSLQ